MLPVLFQRENHKPFLVFSTTKIGTFYTKMEAAFYYKKNKALSLLSLGKYFFSEHRLPSIGLMMTACFTSQAEVRIKRRSSSSSPSEQQPPRRYEGSTGTAVPTQAGRLLKTDSGRWNFAKSGQKRLQPWEAYSKAL